MTRTQLFRMLMADLFVSAAERIAGQPIGDKKRPRAVHPSKTEIVATIVEDVAAETLVLHFDRDIPQCRAVKLMGPDCDEVLFVDEAPKGPFVKIRRPTVNAYPVGAKAKVIQ